MSRRASVNPGWFSKLAIAAGDIKLAHTIFAMPFALLGAFVALAAAWPGGLAAGALAGRLGLIVLCMVFARTFAMLANRLLDRRFDARNPRTSSRAFAAGRLSGADGVAMLVGSGVLFQLSAAGFGFFYGNWIPVLAGPAVLGWLAFYSYTKRLTALCHLVLGAALAASPLAAAVAIGGLEGLTATVWLLAGFVACWVAGFDVIYAMQDETFDRAEGLHSIPALLGAGGAGWAARCLHFGAIGLLGVMAVVGLDGGSPLGVGFAVAAMAAAGLIWAEHLILAMRGAAAIPLVFFTLNGFVAVLLGIGGIVDVIWLSE